MLNERYLISGLDGLSHASENDYFINGHIAASVIAAYFLCIENLLEVNTQNIIESRIDEQMLDDDIFLPAPDEASDELLLSHLLDTLASGASDLRAVGHNVIFATIAIKAFKHKPEAVTPYRIEGICKLIRSFNTTPVVEVIDKDNITSIDDETKFIEFIFTEVLRSFEKYTGYGYGHAGHLLTFGHAVIELSRFGYHNIALQAHKAYSMYVKTVRRGPKQTDQRVTEHQKTDLNPLEHKYWQKKQSLRSGLGHAFKYPYSFYSLLPRLDDLALKERCIKESYRIF